MSFAEDLGVGPRELVSFVGSGGKTTLLLRLGGELASKGHNVVMTTTTRMGTDQIPGSARVVHGPKEVGPGFTYLVGEIDEPKVIGVEPTVVDDLFSSDVEYVLVEADGARRRSIKAPAEHEPVVPARTTIQVNVIGLEAIGGVIGEVAHRPEIVANILGKGLADRLSEEDLMAIATSERGGLARVATEARLVVALTHRGAEDAGSIANAISEHQRIERVLLVDLDA